jgi:hypothetical protein
LVLGAFGLPVSLTLILICGAELFTGNTAFVTAAMIEVRFEGWGAQWRATRARARLYFAPQWRRPAPRARPKPRLSLNPS